MTFEPAYKFVLKEELGYVNDPSDSGGATKDGVIQTTYDAYRRAHKLELRAVSYMQNSEREAIYQQYWDDGKAEFLPAGLGFFHFDCAFNMGIEQAAKLLQRALSVKDDGIIGPVTIKAAQELSVGTSISAYAERRRKFYQTLTKNRPKDMKFLKGWMLRTNRAERMALAQAGVKTV